LDDAYLGLARAHERLGNAPAAEAIYRQAVDRRPRYWATYVWLGNFYRERARYQEAVEAYERSVAMNPANALTHARLGTIYMYLGRYDDAAEACRRSAAITPTYTAFVNWGVTLYRRRDFDGAAALLTRACEIRQSYQCTGNLARTYYWSGRRKEAEALLERAAQLAAGELGVNERDVNARLSLAEFSAKLERPVEAMRQLESAEIGDDPHLLFFVALVHAQLGNRDRAFEWLGKAVKAKVPVAELTAWPELDSLRTDARFKALISGAAGL
jgi:tetratricopeptide (TPR) repeat protein